MTLPTGLVLAGGRGSRMGEGPPKPLRMLGTASLLAHVVARFRPQVSDLLLNAPDRPDYRAFGLPIVSDRRPGFAGPLAGLEAGLAELLVRGAAEALVAVPSDTPFLPDDLVGRLASVAAGRPVVAESGGRLHPTVGLWPANVLPHLSAWLDEGRPAALRAFLDETGFATVRFTGNPQVPGGDPFLNVNSPDDLARCAAHLTKT